MNTYNIEDKQYVNSEEFKNFMEQNPTYGYLRIRAYAASGAIPISGLKIEITTKINKNRFIFFEGYTNESGLIDNISLPAPKLETNNLDIPNKTIYEIKATYLPNNTNLTYEVNMYENVFVVQNINIVPDSSIEKGVI